MTDETPKQDRRVTGSYQLLRIVFGAIPIVAGLDKFTNLLVDWSQYLAPAVERVLPVSANTFMMAVGVIEIVAGIVVLSPLTRVGAYVVSAWLAGISVNLLLAGYFDVAARDLALAAGAFVLARLTEVVVPQSVATWRRERQRVHATATHA